MDPLRARLRPVIARILPIATLLAMALVEIAGRRWEGG
jgi:hypothetical protein